MKHIGENKTEMVEKPYWSEGNQKNKTMDSIYTTSKEWMELLFKNKNRNI
jgi:hypothetical protein